MSAYGELGMDPTYWGPGVWITVHLWALNLNLTDNDAFVNFMTNVVNTLPCHMCRGHAQTYLRDNPLKPSRTDPMWAFFWTVDMHNSVNKRKGRDTWSYEDAKSYYYDLMQMNKKSEFNCLGCGEKTADNSMPENIIHILN